MSYAAVLAGRTIGVGPPPWVVRRLFLGKIGPVPGGRPLRRLNERLQALAGRGIPADVELIELQCGRQALDLHLGCLGARAAEIADHARRNEARKQHENDQHDQQLDQREPGLSRRLCYARRPRRACDTMRQPSMRI